MAINYNIYSNSNASSKTIAIDFVANYLASSSNGVSETTRYFMKFTTTARDSDNASIGAKISESTGDLILNGEKQRVVDTAAAYTDIKSMVVDYVYDFVYGHDAGEHSTSVHQQKPMKFD